MGEEDGLETTTLRILLYYTVHNAMSSVIHHIHSTLSHTHLLTSCILKQMCKVRVKGIFEALFFGDRVK